MNTGKNKKLERREKIQQTINGNYRNRIMK